MSFTTKSYQLVTSPLVTRSAASARRQPDKVLYGVSLLDVLLEDSTSSNIHNSDFRFHLWLKNYLFVIIQVSYWTIDILHSLWCHLPSNEHRSILSWHVRSNTLLITLLIQQSTYCIQLLFLINSLNNLHTFWTWLVITDSTKFYTLT